jgi:hypothetical protein
MNPHTIKKAQERFKLIGPDYVAECIQEAFKHKTTAPDGALSIHLLNRAVASMSGDRDFLSLCEIGYKMAEEYKATRLYKILAGYDR